MKPTPPKPNKSPPHIGISLVAGYLALDKAIVILQLLLRLRSAAGATRPRILILTDQHPPSQTARGQPPPNPAKPAADVATYHFQHHAAGGALVTNPDG